MRTVDRWLFAAAPSGPLRRVRTLLALLIAARLVLTPFVRLADIPDALFVPVSDLVPFRAVPPAALILGTQAAGTVAALVAARGRRGGRLGFALGWLALFALAGLRSSQGKILHNDVVLLLAALPFLGAPAVATDDEVSPRYGWPIRTSMVVIATTYFVIGAQKLVHSGLDWVTGDNMRWVMYAAAASGRAFSAAPARFVADHAWLATACAALLLVTELAMPVAVLVRRARPVLVAAAVGLHVGTWVLLGLDYWLWAAVAPVVFLLGQPLRRPATWPGPSGRPPAAAATRR